MKTENNVLSPAQMPLIVAALRRQLGWSHFKFLIPLNDPLKRNFYAQMCRIERWSTRTLEKQIKSMLYERTALSRKPEELISQEIDILRDEDYMTTDVILKDPYILDFLGMQDRYLEKDLEDAILREIELFLLELGSGFTFIARQKRLQIDNRDYYIDLLFYNRKLKRLVAIDLEIGEFEAAYKGQMELYLRWLAKYEQEHDEASPLGIILCTGKTHEQIELLELDKSGIHVAEYMTALPSRYRKNLKEQIPALIDKWQKKIGVEVKDWGIRHMKTKWGTCTIAKSRIWLNLELAKKPQHCLEYIIVHEMVHLIERNHNDNFIACMDKFMPQWHFYKEELNRSMLSHEIWSY